MAVSRAKVVDQNFVKTLSTWTGATAQADLNQPVRAGFRLTGRQAIALFESMVQSKS